MQHLMPRNAFGRCAFPFILKLWQGHAGNRLLLCCCTCVCALLPEPSSVLLPKRRLSSIRLRPPLSTLLFSLSLAAAGPEGLSDWPRQTAAAAEMTLAAGSVLALDNGGSSLCQLSALYVSPVPMRRHTDRLLSCSAARTQVLMWFFFRAVQGGLGFYAAEGAPGRCDTSSAG
jgi:hypothetical protein